MRAIDLGCTGKQVMYILRGFKTSDDAFRLSHYIVFDCSIRPFLDLFRSWLYIFHLSRFSGDGLVLSVSVFSGFFYVFAQRSVVQGGQKVSVQLFLYCNH